MKIMADITKEILMSFPKYLYGRESPDQKLLHDIKVLIKEGKGVSKIKD